MTATPSPDAPTEPSEEAGEIADGIFRWAAACGLISYRDISPLRDAMVAALDRFHADGVREERGRIAAHIDCPPDCRYANASGTCQRTSDLCSHYVAEAIRAGETP